MTPQLAKIKKKYQFFNVPIFYIKKYSSHPLCIPVSLFLGAFFIRLHILIQYFPLFDSYGKYEWAAKKILSGENIGVRILDFSPLYTYITVIFQYLFLGNRFFLILFQNLLGAVNSVLIFFVGKKIFGRSAGLIAGIIYALSRNVVLYEYIFEPITIVLFLNSLAVLTLLLAEESVIKKSNQAKPALFYYLSGIFIGLSVITRPNIVLFFPFVFLWLCIKSYKKKQNRLLSVSICYLLFILGTVTCIAPVLARNYMAAGKLTFAIMSPGQVFHQGNNIEAQGLGIGYPPVLTDIYSYEKEQGDYMHEMYRKVATYSISGETSFVQSSFFWTDLAVNFIKKHPGKYIQILLNKGISFFNPFEMHDIPLAYPKQDSLKKFPFLTVTLLFPLSFLGVIILRGTNTNALLLYCLTFVYGASNLIFFVSSRQRLPIFPFLSCFSAYSVIYFLSLLKTKEFKKLFFLTGLFLIFFSIPLIPFEIIETNKIKSRRLYDTVFINLYKSSTFIKNNNQALAGRQIKAAIAQYPMKINEFAAGDIFYGEEGLIPGAIKIGEKLYPLEKNDTYEDYYLGHLYLTGNKYDKAFSIFKKLENRNMLGKISLLTGLPKKAIEYYELALDNKEFSLEAAAQLAVLYEKRNDLEKFTRLMSDINNFYDHISVSYYMGLAYYNSGQFKKAISLWNTIAVLFPDYPIIHVYLSRAYAKIGSVDESFEQFEISAKLKPSLYIKIIALEGLLEENIIKDPKNLQNYWRLGRLYKKRGDFKNALFIYLKGRDILTGSIDKDYSFDEEKINRFIARIYYGLGDEYLVSENIDMALFSLDKAKKFKFKDPVLYLKLGYCYKEKGLEDKAISNFRTYLALKPKDAQVNKILGNLYYNKKDYLGAQRYYKKCIALNRIDADCYYNLGLVSYDINRLKEALYNYKKAVELSPQDPDLHYNLALVYSRMGKKKEADKELNISKGLQ